MFPFGGIHTGLYRISWFVSNMGLTWQSIVCLNYSQCHNLTSMSSKKKRKEKTATTSCVIPVERHDRAMSVTLKWQWEEGSARAWWHHASCCHLLRVDVTHVGCHLTELIPKPCGSYRSYNKPRRTSNADPKEDKERQHWCRLNWELKQTWPSNRDISCHFYCS